MGRVCIACGDPLGSNRANEHVIAAWLLNELGNTEEQLTQFLANSVTREVEESRKPHVMDSFKEGRVCEKCNNGWMCNLEGEAKAVLPEFVRGNLNITQLPDSDALAVARWTLKTAVVLSHATGMGSPLPAEHLEFLRKHPTELPAQVGVFAWSVSPAGDFSFLQRSHWENAVASDTNEEPDLSFMGQSAYKVAIELKHLLLMAAYIPRASSRFLITAGVHVPIWPNSILPCRRVALTTDSLSKQIPLLSAFSDSLGALHI